MVEKWSGSGPHPETAAGRLDNLIIALNQTWRAPGGQTKSGRQYYSDNTLPFGEVITEQLPAVREDAGNESETRYITRAWSMPDAQRSRTSEQPLKVGEIDFIRSQIIDAGEQIQPFLWHVAYSLFRDEMEPPLTVWKSVVCNTSSSRVYPNRTLELTSMEQDYVSTNIKVDEPHITPVTYYLAELILANLAAEVSTDLATL
jgi:hypothetical protein